MVKKTISVNTQSIICLFVLSVIFLSSCTADRLAYDHEELRQQVITLYEKQIMDNLIRTYRNDIVLHLNYSNFAGESTTDLEVGSDYSDKDTEDLYERNAIGLESDGWNIAGKAKIHNKLSLNAQPVINKRAGYVYGRYRKFINDGHFISGPNQPEYKVFKMCKCQRQADPSKPQIATYYWIPFESSQAYYDLVLEVSYIQRPDQPIKIVESTTQTTKEIYTDVSRQEGNNRTNTKTNTKEKSFGSSKESVFSK